MAQHTAFPLLQRLQATLTEHLPFCSGILELPSDKFDLYYGKEDARFINLSKGADHGALAALTQACNSKEVRVCDSCDKAGEMDPTDFITRFDVEATGLLDTVRLGLLSRADAKRPLRAELHKLNVYYSAHSDAVDLAGTEAQTPLSTDAPRNQSAFGSLVVVFPTQHEGGALLLSHNDDEYTFDASRLLAARPTSMAYLAFLSAVDHERAFVVSGHRVALTYSLC
uniref:Cell surface hydrophobicity-associated protein n=1 Tax=Ganoderma boninense TaxID=34458 RepID=A0A5K1K7I0_9APHY